MVIGGYTLLGLLSVGLISAWFVSWRNNQAYIVYRGQARRTGAAAGAADTQPRQRSELPPLLPAFDAVRSLASTTGEGVSIDHPPLSLGFGLFQGRKLDGAARVAYEHMLGDAAAAAGAAHRERLRGNDQPDSQYESLKAYLMLYDAKNFDGSALKSFVETDWDQRLTREIAADQREALSATSTH